MIRPTLITQPSKGPGLGSLEFYLTLGLPYELVNADGARISYEGFEPLFDRDATPLI
jgi:hypothetical protein